ncbi:hypothetical protein P7C70_g6618, partial [Phenoliferia sp. Uapishka_3]
MAQRKKKAAPQAGPSSGSKRARASSGTRPTKANQDSDEEEPQQKRRRTRATAAVDSDARVEEPLQDDGDGTSDTVDVDSAVAASLVQSAVEIDSTKETAPRGTSPPDGTDIEELEEAPSPLKGLSPEARRAVKGKGKATTPTPSPTKTAAPSVSTAQEAIRRERELAYKDNIISQQGALLASLRSSMACNVCLETLDRPYSLACGHVFCRKCLFVWFHRPDPSAAPDQPFPGSPHDSHDFDSDDEADIILGSASSSRSSSSSQSSGSDPIRAASSDVVLVVSDDDASETESESDTPARPVIRGSLGSRSFVVSGVEGEDDSDAVWGAMEGSMADLVADVMGGSGRAGTRAIEHPSEAAMRAARLSRFASGSASSRLIEAGPSTSRPNTRVSAEAPEVVSPTRPMVEASPRRSPAR